MKTVNNLKSDEPPSEYSPLEKIISEIYLDSAEIITTVRKHSFEVIIYPLLSKIDNYIKSNNHDSIPNVIGTLLTTINDQIRRAGGKEKAILEDLCSELFKQQIEVLNSTKKGKECWQRCIPVMRDTCDFKNYNYQELSRLLKFDSIPYLTDAKERNMPLPYYVWCGTEAALDELIRDIKSKQWISNVIEFKKLFKVISDPDYTFRAPYNNLDKLVVLFSELHSRKLIAVKIKRGHFFPLSLYGLDLDKKLFKKIPKKHFEAIKKNKGYYEALLKEINQLIDLNCGKILDLEKTLDRP